MVKTDFACGHGIQKGFVQDPEITINVEASIIFRSTIWFIFMCRIFVTSNNGGDESRFQIGYNSSNCRY